MSQSQRLGQGGLIDRSKPLDFIFDGKSYQGFQGDTLASALLANGVHLLARSFKYHRPRGVYTAGSDEPNALVQLRTGARTEPNSRATVVELFDGLEATSQNRWPSLKFDALEINSVLSPFFGAGFYYKTFMWPKSFWEKVYEPAIRHAAGLGKPSLEADPDEYERVTQHCDVLVVGAGPTGLLAAKIAAQSGARVVIVDEQAQFGGSLCGETMQLDSQSGVEWATAIEHELQSMDNVLCLPRTTAVAYYDNNVIACVEKVNDHFPVPPEHEPRQRLWRVNTRNVIHACGALERPLVFKGNDRPGVMQSSAVRTYTNQYAVKLGEKVCVFTNNDSGYQTAFDLLDSGSAAVTVIDSRKDITPELQKKLDATAARHFKAAEILDTSGRLRINGLTVSSGGRTETLECDLLAVSGGWNPNIQLHSQTTACGVYDDTQACFIPGESVRSEVSVGAAAGEFELTRGMSDAVQAAQAAVSDCGFSAEQPVSLPEISSSHSLNIEPFWRTSNADGKAFVDFQNDVTTKDIVLAAKEGFISVEHLKRYTTMGMATDQGKGSNVNGLAILAEERGEPIPQVGTTIYRPPVTPVALGVLAGTSRGKHLSPTRKTSSHQWAEKQQAVFIEVGQWLRPHYYPQAGEGLREASYREAAATRESVGLCDVSTLGKIDIQGKDAHEFLNRVYCNMWMSLKVGKARYGLMLREDGMVMDDGTTSRFGEQHFFMTTTTANAAKVMSHLEFHLQVTWPELDVRVASVSEQWAGFAIAGPNARVVLQRLLGDDFDLSHEAFPFLGAAELEFSAQKIKARVFRISFSGELAYEIYIPAGYGESVWTALMQAGKPENITAYGTEALAIMRIEKGHVAGPELSGNTTAGDLGMGKMAGQKKDYIGRFLQQRPALQAENREVVVGIEPVGDSPLWEGAHLVELDAEATTENDLGYLTSVTWSPVMKQWIALALLRNGKERIGSNLRAVNPLSNVETEVKVISPHFFDPDNERLFV